MLVPEVEAGITEDELLAISAAVAAYLGVRAHIRQVRLIQSASSSGRAASTCDSLPPKTPLNAPTPLGHHVKLNITIDGKTCRSGRGGGRGRHAGLPPAYPIGSARLAGSVVGSRRQPRPQRRAGGGRGQGLPQPGVGHRRQAHRPARQSLQVGDSLMVLEAMKMETNITAPVAGQVATIGSRRRHVQADEVVVEFEEPGLPGGVAWTPRPDGGSVRAACGSEALASSAFSEGVRPKARGRGL